MNTFHDVSLIVVNREDTQYLERCLRSCFAQTYPGRSFELLLLHDGKTPMAEEMMATYGRGQAVSGHVTDMEPGAVLKTALRTSTGRFLVFIGADDFISDYMVLFQTIFMYDNPAYDGVLVDYWLVDPQSDRKLSRVSSKERPLLEGTLFKKDLLTKLTHSEGPTLKYEPDMLRDILLRNGNFGHLPLSFYRKRSNPVAAVKA